jgi:hypothetical protein
MSLLPPGATFEELVQDYFLALRGAGVMMSPLDVELLGEWATLGAPFEVVARGIRRAAEQAGWDRRPGEPALRSLRACRRQVAAEIKRHQSLSTGSGADRTKRASRTAAPVSRALEGLEQRHPQLGTAIQKVRSHLESRPGDTPEDGALLLLIRGLPWQERRRLWGQARDWARGAGTSAWARRGARRFHLSALLRERLGDIPFW